MAEEHKHINYEQIDKATGGGIVAKFTLFIPVQINQSRKRNYTDFISDYQIQPEIVFSSRNEDQSMDLCQIEQQNIKKFKQNCWNLDIQTNSMSSQNFAMHNEEQYDQSFQQEVTPSTFPLQHEDLTEISIPYAQKLEQQIIRQETYYCDLCQFEHE